MGLFSKLFGRRSESTPSPAGRTDQALSPPAPGPDPAAFSSARDWLEAASERDFVWRDLGELTLPSRAIFVSDPTGGLDYHMRHTAPVEIDSLRVWVFESGPERPSFEAHTNTLVWLEACGTPPVARGSALEFGVDAACLGLGDLETGHAFTRLTDHELDAGRGDSFEWIGPHIREQPHFARWLDIPPDGHRMFVASTGNDGGFAAVWLYDANDALSGILIDIGGRASDARFLDKLLPPIE